MARRNDHSRDEIRQMALDAAEAIASQEGYSGLSARKVAANIGYTVGTLYLVFKNLDDLIVQVNDRTLSQLYQVMERVSVKNKPPEACILALSHAYIEYASNNTARWSMIYEHVLEDDYELPEPFQQRVQRMFALVENVLRPLGKNKSDKEIAEAARALWSGIHGICILALTRRLDIAGINSVRDLADTLVINFLKGFRENK
ncbi:MAG: TetR/AcrR family transcriptional regulator [Gammaproteobacteria bacterium]|nr:TetR/AcrR family transcriptional regulator [Gammaproteobacteria bacterium]